MKSKKGIFILLPLVIAIWGGVLYKIFFQDGDQPDLHVTPVVALTARVESPGIDTFSLLANYRDPFLGKMTAEKPKVVSPVVLPKREPVKTLQPWPVVAYGGLIKNQNSEKKICLIAVNGQDKITREGDVIDGVELKRVWKDSIELVFQKEKKIIKK